MTMRESKLSPIERRVLDDVDRFVATAFRGSGRFESVEVGTIDDVSLVAERLHEDRPVLVYAIDRAGRQAMVGSWTP